MSRQMMMGVETELGLAAHGADGQPLRRRDALDGLFAAMKGARKYLPGGSQRDFFLTCGRFYADMGDHPEHCTPECDNPWDVVRYILAGRRVLVDAMDQLAREGVRTTVLTSNVDYLTAATWGCHESYLHRADGDVVRAHVLAHLVSRLIYTGAGGFDSRSPGLKFTLSPRVAHLTAAVSSSSTSSRGIVHTKDEPLASGGLHRLHIICGESLSSHTGMWLKAATTALVVAMADGSALGGDPDTAIKLASPLSAMQAFADDTSCRCKVSLADGRQMTAVEIQRYYLEQAEANAGGETMPPWADEACRQWRRMLDRIDLGGAEAVVNVTDWGIKLPLYRDVVEGSAAVSWDSLPYWTHVTATLQRALRDSPLHTVRVEQLLGSESPAPEAVRMMAPYLAAHGLTWEGMRPFVNLRDQLREVDVRFGMLGAEGLFTQLDAAGVLDHRVGGVDNIAHAVEHPPASGRARIRGKCIRRLAKHPEHYTCNWTSITDNARCRRLDLADPFTTRETWEKIQVARPADAPAAGGPVDGILGRIRRQRVRRRLQNAPYAVGQRVLIVGTPDSARGTYVAATAAITEVIEPGGERAAFRLNIDEGRNVWQPRHVLRPESLNTPQREGAT